MISLLLTLLGVVSSVSIAEGINPDDIQFVGYFVKEWKHFHSLNLISCTESLSIRDLSALNEKHITTRYMDIRKPINLQEFERDLDCRQVYAIDLKCSESLLLINKLANAKMFVTFCRSFLLLDAYDNEEGFRVNVEVILAELELTVTSDVVYASKTYINGTLEGESRAGMSGDHYYIYDLW